MGRLDRRDPTSRAEQLVRCRGQRRKQVKRRNAKAPPNPVDELVLVAFVTIPFARLRAMVDELAERVRIIGAKAQGVPIGWDRLCQVAELSPGISEIIERFGKIRPVS